MKVHIIKILDIFRHENLLKCHHLDKVYECKIQFVFKQLRLIMFKQYLRD